MKNVNAQRAAVRSIAWLGGASHLCNVSIIPEGSAICTIEVNELHAATRTVVSNTVPSQLDVRYPSGIECGSYCSASAEDIRVVFAVSHVETGEELNWSASSNQKLTNIVSRIETISR